MSAYGTPDATEEDPIFGTYAAKTDPASLDLLLQGIHLVAVHETKQGTFPANGPVGTVALLFR
jgi:hypothetical protein